MLQSDEVERISETHMLTRGEIYDIRSTFASMGKLSEMWLETQPNLKKDKFLEKTEQGINVSYFMKHCKFLSGALPSISFRIMVAAGKHTFNLL